MTDLDVAIAHKDYDVRGGGEVLAEELARTFDAPLYVGTRDADCEPGGHDLDIRQIASSRLGDYLIGRGGLPRSLAYMNRWKLHAEQLYDYDTVILSGNEPLWWHHEPDQTVIAYTHSTPRWLYDLFPERVREADGPKSTVGRWLQEAQRQLYEHQITRPDLFVANSERVARRIQAYWNISPEQVRVVYPPVDTHAFDAADAPTRDYYFALSRLCRAKRFGEMIEAFQDTDLELKIAGRGPDEPRLRDLAAGHDNIELLGHISEDEKRRRMAEAKAFVFNARNEDFGIAPVEAMAAGTPVIGVREGFTQHQICDGENGHVYDRGNLAQTAVYFDEYGVDWSAEEIAAFAETFSVQQFREGMRAAVAEARERSQIEVPWEDRDAEPERPRAVADGGDGE